MKKIAPFVLLLIAASCNNNGSTATTDHDSTSKASKAKQDVVYPYAIGYSAQFENGDPEKSKAVLGLWKDYDNNTLGSDNEKALFADSVTLIFPNMKMRTTRDSAIAGVKAARSYYNAVSSNVDVVMSVKSTDKGGDWVLVWGDEIHTNKKNVTDTVALHEVWGFNKAGKVEFLQQYMSKK